ncbi:uncharacterized protein [Diadema antillarum]|uniref:uncharacterized protein n=1 Tax=Diadema antillarum TaxID=105358 RepID=UPI003A838562
MMSGSTLQFRCGKISRCQFRLFPALCLAVIFIYILSTLSFVARDHSISTFGLVHNSDVRIRKFAVDVARDLFWPSKSCNVEVELVNDKVLGDGCFFRDRIQCDDMPTINSAFVDIVEKNVVFIGTRFRDEDWLNQTFVCKFPDGNVSVADPTAVDDRSLGAQPQYVFVMRCPIAEGFHASFYPTRKLPDRFQVTLSKNTAEQNVYKKIPVCKSGWHKTYYLAICTMVKDVDEYFADWLLYYRYMGVEHVFVYDNSDRGTLVDVLDHFISLGFVTVIPWSHSYSPTKTYLEAQIAHENDCLWRHRHDVNWLLKIDVDEFMQPMYEKEIKLVDIVRRFEKEIPPSIAVIRVRNWFFSRPMTNVSRKITTAPSVIGRNPWRSPEPTGEGRGREKCFIRPNMVHYFKIHAVKLGGESLTLNPYTEIRLVHYRSENPRHRNFHIHKFIYDSSMVDLWRSIKRWSMYSTDRVVMYGFKKTKRKLLGAA